ncbi:MAG: Lrp/AsnC family transcriptional regulator [Promethearchaeota archaeon]
MELQTTEELYEEEETITVVLDEKDSRILELLQENSSQSLKDIAENVKLSIPTVRKRIIKLEECGIIKKWTVILDGKKLGRDVIAFIGVDINYNIPGAEKMIRLKIVNMKDVMEVFHMAAFYHDYFVKVKTKNTSTLETMIRTINRLQGVKRTRTVIVLSPVKEETTFSLF